MPRGYRRVIVAAFIGLILVGCLGWGLWSVANPYEQQRQNPRASEQRYKALALDKEFAAYPVEDADACYRAKTHDSADLCAQWRAAIAAEESADAAKRANLLSIIGAVLTIVGLIFIYTTFRETKRTAQAAVGGVQEAQRAADAAHQANLETRYSQRAWMSHTAVDVDIVHGDDRLLKRLEVKLEWVNAGQTSARNCIIRSGSPTFWGTGKPEQANFDEIRPQLDALNAGQPTQVGPNCKISSHIMIFDRETAQAMLEGKVTVFLWSAIDYFDIFSDELRRSEVMIDFKLFADPEKPHDLSRLERPDTLISGPFNLMT